MFFIPNNTRGFLLFTPQGLPGETGDEGGSGAPGAKGEQGAKGSLGPRGRPGPGGPQGQPGDKGDAGTAGGRGVDGRPGFKGDTVIQAVVITLFFCFLFCFRSYMYIKLPKQHFTTLFSKHLENTCLGFNSHLIV